MTLLLRRAVVSPTPRDVSTECCVSLCRNREPVREGSVHPQDPAGGPEGHAGGDALPVRLPQPVSIHLDRSRHSQRVILVHLFPFPIIPPGVEALERP